MGQRQVKKDATLRDANNSDKTSSQDAKDSVPSSTEVDEDGPASQILEGGETVSPSEEASQSYLTGWRLQTLLLGQVDQEFHLKKFTTNDLPRVCLNLFLSNLETTIVSTSLVSISNSLHSFSSSSWVVTAYLVTYTGRSCAAQVFFAHASQASWLSLRN